MRYLNVKSASKSENNAAIRLPELKTTAKPFYCGHIAGYDGSGNAGDVPALLYLRHYQLRAEKSEAAHKPGKKNRRSAHG
jgi:hypothetical protein